MEFERINFHQGHKQFERGYNKAKRKKPMQTAAKLLMLFIMTIFLPGLLLGIPIYMRYFVYQEQIYPVGMSDIRLIDAQISTTWCQSQTVRSNATFNAFLVSEYPKINSDLRPVSMTRRLILEDDMKEYWGFYLLKGSIVTVSTCARWPGASLMIVKGHKHLRQCAYIGDNSSEELDEINTLKKKVSKTIEDDPSNDPAIMTKINPDIMLNGKIDKLLNINKTQKLENLMDKFSTTLEESEIRENKIDNKFGNYVHLKYAEEMEEILKGAKWGIRSINEKSTFTLTDTRKSKLSSKEVFADILIKLKKMGKKGKHILGELNKELLDLNNANVSQKNESKNRNLPNSNSGSEKSSLKIKRFRRHVAMDLFSNPMESREANDDEGVEMIEHEEIPHIYGTVNETSLNDRSDSEFWSSFSSSEERLLSCDGLLLNLPLICSTVCDPTSSESDLLTASLDNSVTYRIPSDGYYFFIFNSENEVDANFLNTHFKIEKATYNLSDVEASCKNETSSCTFPLRFWSSQKVIFELPVKLNDSLWNEEFLTVSVCEPRTIVYAGFIVAIPFMVLIFAFQ